MTQSNSTAFQGNLKSIALGSGGPTGLEGRERKEGARVQVLGAGPASVGTWSR